MEPLAPFNGTSEPMLALGRFFREQGLYTFVRWNTVMTNPPLTITEEELAHGFDIIDRGLAAIEIGSGSGSAFGIGARASALQLWPAATLPSPMPEPADRPSPEPEPVSERRRDRLRDFLRRRLAAQVGRSRPAFAQHPLDRAQDAVVRVVVAEVRQHQRAGPDRADRVGDALAGDVGRRAVDRLEHRRETAARG